MKNKGRRHKAGHNEDMSGIANCKGALVILTRPITQMGKGHVARAYKKKKWMKKAWTKRVRGYFKSQTKEIL
jgi:hypothetical protein